MRDPRGRQVIAAAWDEYLVDVLHARLALAARQDRSPLPAPTFRQRMRAALWDIRYELAALIWPPLRDELDD